MTSNISSDKISRGQQKILIFRVQRLMGQVKLDDDGAKVVIVFKRTKIGY